MGIDCPDCLNTQCVYYDESFDCNCTSWDLDFKESYGTCSQRIINSFVESASLELWKRRI